MDVVTWILDNSFMILYAIAVGVAIWRYPRYFDTPLKLFPILLMYTFLNELLGSFIQDYLFFTHNANNWLVYNIYNLIFFLYFYYIFWVYMKNDQYKRLIVYGSVLFLTTSFINIFIQDFSVDQQLYAYIVGGLVLIGCIILYALQLRSLTGRWFSPYNLISWLSLGMLIFYVGYIPIKIIRQYNAYHELNDGPVIRLVHVLLIVIMYFCFILGFVKMSRKSLN